MDCGRWIAGLVKNQKFLPELVLKRICRQVKVLLLEENTVKPVQVVRVEQEHIASIG